MLGRDRDALPLLRRFAQEFPDRPGYIHLATTLSALIEDEPEEAVAAAERFVGEMTDPEALFYVARALARVGATERAVDVLRRVVEGGFTCPSSMVHDPWLKPLQRDADFRKVLTDAEARHHEAAVAFADADGPTVLGMMRA